MSLTDFIHPDDVFQGDDGHTYIKYPDYLIKLVLAPERRSERIMRMTLTEHYPLVVLGIIGGDTTISVERIEEMQGPWTFENELEAIDDRGW